MRRIEVYCQQAFLDSFIEKMTGFSLVDGSPSQDYVYHLYRLLFVNEQTMIYTNLTNEEITNHTNPYIKALLKKNRIESRPEEFIEALQDSTQKKYFENIGGRTRFFMLDTSWNLAEKLEEKFGYVVVSKDKIERIDKFFTFHKVALSRENENKWEFVHKYKHPCNSMVITDEYIAKNVVDVKNNIVPILKRIMPSKLEVPFHLTIIGFSKLPKTEYDCILAELKKSFTLLSYQVHLTIVNYDYHDRFIFTNYFQFSAGYGFNMVDEKNGAKYVKDSYKTVFEAVSVALTNTSDTGNIFKSYDAKIKEISQIFRDQKVYGEDARKQNRLLA